MFINYYSQSIIERAQSNIYNSESRYIRCKYNIISLSTCSEMK
jgi:hypothetical protein